MESGMMKFLTSSLWMAAFILSMLAAASGQNISDCRSRRCLAKMLIDKTYISQPQYENCTQVIQVPFMEYQTLSVDTKKLRLNCRLSAFLVWTDLELAWNNSDYQYNEVVLPINKVWTPELHVTNGVTTTMKHSSQDLVVRSDGTVEHNVIITAEINCEVNLFNYPFAADECPVAIHTWSTHGCGTTLDLQYLYLLDGTRGDWTTDYVYYEKRGDDQNYIKVGLRIKYLSPFITLLLPTFLILLADVTSFALPLGGGERNSFKVTLVLSFTMFLIILNDSLPGDSLCSPIIRTHFCICLVFLMVSMLVSLVLTRVAKEGGLFFCCSTGCVLKCKKKKEAEDDEAKADISVIQPSASEEHVQMLRKVVNFLEDTGAKQQESERHQKLADTLDKAFFWIYAISATIYFSSMMYVMVKYKCEVNHFLFWYDWPTQTG